MVVAHSIAQKLTLQEFLQLPDTKPAREYINGKIVQKPMPQGEHSRIQSRLCTEINKVSESQKLALALTEIRCTFGQRSRRSAVETRYALSLLRLGVIDIFETLKSRYVRQSQRNWKEQR